MYISDIRNQNVKIFNIKIAISFLKIGLPVIIRHKSESLYVYSSEVLELNSLINDDFELSFTPQKASFLLKSESKTGLTLNLKNQSTYANTQILDAANRLNLFAGLLPSTAIYQGGKPISIHANLEFIPQLDLQDISGFEYEKNYDLKHVSNSKITLKNAPDSTFYVFRSMLSGEEHYALVVGNCINQEAPLVRLHSSCYTGDLLASLRCDCREQLQDAIFTMSNQEDGGILLYLMQEGRGIGLANKIKAYKVQNLIGLDTVESNTYLGFNEDERNFVAAQKMLDFFNIKRIKLLTNNPKKKADMESLGIEVKDIVKTVFASNDHNADYLEVKNKKMNHSFKKP